MLHQQFISLHRFAQRFFTFAFHRFHFVICFFSNSILLTFKSLFFQKKGSALLTVAALYPEERLCPAHSEEGPLC